MKFELIERSRIVDFIAEAREKLPLTHELYSKCTDSVGPNSFWFKIDTGSEVIGAYCLWFDHFMEDTVHLFSLEIMPEHRGKFLGTQVIAFTEAACNALRLRGVTLIAHDDGVVDYYKKFGFVETEIDGCTFFFKANKSWR